MGRPLTDGTHNAVALVSSDPAWGSEDFQGDEAFKLHLANVSELMRAELSQEWLRDALFEHASVASFARAALELMQHGAPPHLLKATLKAGLDEVTHARLCFGLASAYAGTPLGAGSMPDMPAVRSQTLAQLAVDVFLEGAVEESTAVLVAVRAAAGCEVPAAHRAQTRIADDETTHAALAWATIAWALQTGGDPVRDALLAAIQAIENQIAQTRLPLSAPDPWLIHGRLPPEAQQQARIDAWHGIIKPTCTRLLGACFERMENQVVTRRTV